MGRGRHAQLLARAGFRTFGVDVKLDAVERPPPARARNSLIVRGWCADLTETRLPRGFFDVVLVTRYLQRDLFPAIREMVKAGESLLMRRSQRISASSDSDRHHPIISSSRASCGSSSTDSR